MTEGYTVIDVQLTDSPWDWRLFETPSGQSWIPEENDTERLSCEPTDEKRTGWGCRLVLPGKWEPPAWNVFDDRVSCFRYLYRQTRDEEVIEAIHEEAGKVLGESMFRIVDARVQASTITIGTGADELDVYCVILDKASAPEVQKVCLSKAHAYIEAIEAFDQSLKRIEELPI